MHNVLNCTYNCLLFKLCICILHSRLNLESCNQCFCRKKIQTRFDLNLCSILSFLAYCILCTTPTNFWCDYTYLNVTLFCDSYNWAYHDNTCLKYCTNYFFLPLKYQFTNKYVSITYVYLLCDHLKSSSLVVKIHSYYCHVLTAGIKWEKIVQLKENSLQAFFGKN